MYNVWIMHPDGRVVHTTQPKAPDLKQLQEAVGGYIETIPHWSKIQSGGVWHTRGKGYCNEDGIMKGLRYNKHATTQWRAAVPSGDPQRMTLLGTVVFYAKAKEA